MADLFLHLGPIAPVGYEDLNADHQKKKVKLGQLAFMQDSYGFRVFSYVRNTKGSAVAQGDLNGRTADVTEASVTTGTTTGWTKTGASYGTYTNQPGAFVGRLAKVDTNGSSAGAAPEGECNLIIANSATAVTIDAGRPFTAAIPATSSVRVISFDTIKASAASDLAVATKGVSVGANGISDGNYGWVQIYGVCPDVKHRATTAFTAGDPVIAYTSSVDAKGATTAESWVGWQIGTHNNPVTSNKSPVFLNLFGWIRPIA